MKLNSTKVAEIVVKCTVYKKTDLEIVCPFIDSIKNQY